ncbi:MAG: hypothetical protein Q7S43_00845 [bacterium]|nr:hypothetical protein [bacterium]
MIISAPKNIVDFLESRGLCLVVKDKKIEFRVLDKDPRSICFDNDLQLMTISAAGISDLSNYYNQIGLLQAFYRFIGSRSLEDNIFLLHGSAALSGNGKAILFGDNGRSIGKTLSSMELAYQSRQYIGDEFIFLDTNSFEIFSDDGIPIHARPEVREHFTKKHGTTIAGEFFSKQELGWQFAKRRELGAMVYVNFSEDEERCTELSQDVAKEYAMITLCAHLQKMFNPELDRFQFISQSDSGKAGHEQGAVIERAEVYDRIKPRLEHASVVIAKTVPSFELFVNIPCHIPIFIDTIINNKVKNKLI